MKSTIQFQVHFSLALASFSQSFCFCAPQIYCKLVFLSQHSAWCPAAAACSFMQENADNQSAQRETEHLSGSKTLKVGKIII